MEKLLEILNELNADIDFAHCDTLIDDGLLDSFAILVWMDQMVHPFLQNLCIKNRKYADTYRCWFAYLCKSE